MTDDPNSPYSPPEPPAQRSPLQEPPYPLAPTLNASLLWLFTFVMLFFVAAMLYVMGYGMYLGLEYAAQGVSAPPQAEIEKALSEHLYSLNGIAGVYITQFLLILPVVLFASNLANQAWYKTLALHPFRLADLKYWLAVAVVFITAEYFLNQIIEIDTGEFLQLLNGSQHLLLAVIVSLLAPVLEEFIFRGYLFTAWRHTRLGLSGTLLLTSSIFACLHLGQYDGILIFLLFIFSIILGLAREKTGSVWVPVILHGVNNFASAVTVIYLGLL